MEVSFSNPQYLWFLLSIPVLILAHFFSLRYVKRKAIKFSNFEAIERITGQRLISKNITLLIIRGFVLTLVILAVAGATFWYNGLSSDADFVLAIDASASMLANDYSPDRITAAKDAASLFVDKLTKNTKIGVVSFAGTSFVEHIPDNNFVMAKKAIDDITVKPMGGTDIGEAVITGVNLLITAEKPKVIVLLSDGRTNVGEIIPEAISYVNENHASVFTIGMGTTEGGKLGEFDVTSTLDEETLRQIADGTKGKYYRAKDNNELVNAYNEIANLKNRKTSFDLVIPLLIVALLLIFFDWVLVSSRYRALP